MEIYHPTRSNTSQEKLTRLDRVKECATSYMKTVMIYRSEIDFTLLNYEDTLSGEDVVPGFSCQVAELFE